MEGKSPAEQIDDIIKAQSGWKGDILTKIRSAIKTAAPDIVEEVKWKTASRPEGLPVWSYNGIVCIAETWKDNVKLIFFDGVKMNDPEGLFNARLKSATDRAVEFKEGTTADQTALGSLVLEAIDIKNRT